mgnify:CR=1 FL=1
MYALQMWGEFGGSGVTIGLVIAIMIFGKREDNKAIATLSLVPGLFNINETVTFGIPMVLNPILGIPFVVTPLITIIIGYVLTVIGFCPVACLTVPWTTPPIVFGFLACGANVMGAVTQAILVVVSTVIYVPFLISYENIKTNKLQKLNIDKLNKIMNKGGIPRPLFFKKIFNEYELTLLKKIDIY